MKWLFNKLNQYPADKMTESEDGQAALIRHNHGGKLECKIRKMKPSSIQDCETGCPNRPNNNF